MLTPMRVRFAPSPTGPLHIGGARSALFNWLMARKTGGQFIVRIEDTDLERSSRESEVNILDSLRWLGLDWDEGIEVGGPHGPYRQTERLELYREAAAKLLASGQAYHCYCSEEELEAEREELLARGELPRYLGKCRHLSPSERAEKEAAGIKPVIRFRVPEGDKVVIDDLVRGQVVFETDGIGDFVIVKSDGIPTYNFAVVIDDSSMGITHVIRGEEHLSNTPRQVLLYQALGLKAPQFAHVSLILGKDRTKMSKRHGSTAVEQYKKMGYLPEALINFLVLLGWSPQGEEEIFSLEQLIQEFSLERVAKSPAVFDLDKLNYLNGYYIRHSAPERIAELARPFLLEAGYQLPEGEKYLWLIQAVQERINCLAEISEAVAVFYRDEVIFEDEAAREVIQQEQVPAVLEALLQKLAVNQSPTPEEAKAMLKAITKELKLGGKQVFMPIRIALTGQAHGPELYYLLAILGYQGVKKRLDSLWVDVG